MICLSFNLQKSKCARHMNIIHIIICFSLFIKMLRYFGNDVDIPLTSLNTNNRDFVYNKDSICKRNVTNLKTKKKKQKNFDTVL
jgi:hypothetical protein